MNEIFFKDLIVEHNYKKNLKNSYISINPHAKIILKTPKVSQKYINDLLLKKEMWIRKQLIKAEENPIIKINLEDEVLLFGEVYSIDVPEADKLRELLKKTRLGSTKNILKCYDNFYKLYSKEYITQRLEYFSDIMNLKYTEVKFRKMKSRWGSCNSKRVITFNTELLKVKKKFIDYVIVHELSHLVHMNHSRNFHDLVDKYILNSKQLRKEFKNVNLSRYGDNCISTI
jgi:predicted metal-dependent hydrolase